MVNGKEAKSERGLSCKRNTFDTLTELCTSQSQTARTKFVAFELN